MVAAVVITDAEYPPAGDVRWRVYTLSPAPFREDFVAAHSWYEARSKGRDLFGVHFEHVEAVRDDRDIEREDEEHAKARKRADSTMGKVA